MSGFGGQHLRDLSAGSRGAVKRPGRASRVTGPVVLNATASRPGFPNSRRSRVTRRRFWSVPKRRVFAEPTSRVTCPVGPPALPLILMLVYERSRAWSKKDPACSAGGPSPLYQRMAEPFPAPPRAVTVTLPTANWNAGRTGHLFFRLFL